MHLFINLIINFVYATFTYTTLPSVIGLIELLFTLGNFVMTLTDLMLHMYQKTDLIIYISVCNALLNAIKLLNKNINSVIIIKYIALNHMT